MRKRVGGSTNGRDPNVHGGRIFGNVCEPAKNPIEDVSSKDSLQSNDSSLAHDEACGAPCENKVVIKYSIVKADLKGEDRFDVKPLMSKRIIGPEAKVINKTFSYFAVLDGHNGQASAEFCVHNLLLNIFDNVGEESCDWDDVIPQAMVDGFARTHSDYSLEKKLSGTTATSIIVDGMTVFVAGVGDSRAILDDGKCVYDLTEDHRVDTNKSERNRILSNGGKISKVKIGGTQHGPLRVDGKLCVSRSIGDFDVSGLVTENPDVCVAKLPKRGGRIIIASDGVWDVLSSQKAASFARKYPDDTRKACERVLRKALRVKGFRDDTTVIVLDILPIGISPTFKDCLKKGSLFGNKRVESERPSLVRLKDLVPNSIDPATHKPRLVKESHELDQLKASTKIQPALGLSGAYNSGDDVWPVEERAEKNHTHLHYYNRGVAKLQHTIEMNRLNSSMRKGNFRETDEIENHSESGGTNLSKAHLTALKGYPQRILVQTLSNDIRQ